MRIITVSFCYRTLPRIYWNVLYHDVLIEMVVMISVMRRENENETLSFLVQINYVGYFRQNSLLYYVLADAQTHVAHDTLRPTGLKTVFRKSYSGCLREQLHWLVL